MSQQPQPAHPRRHLWVSRSVAVLLVGLTVAVLVGFGLAAARWMRGSISASTTGYAVVSAESITVDFVLNAPADAQVLCQVRAQASDGLDVGMSEVSIDMQGQKRRTQRVQVPTRRLASKGELTSCTVKRDPPPVDQNSQR